MLPGSAPARPCGGRAGDRHGDRPGPVSGPRVKVSTSGRVSGARPPTAPARAGVTAADQATAGTTQEQATGGTTEEQAAGGTTEEQAVAQVAALRPAAPSGRSSARPPCPPDAPRFSLAAVAGGPAECGRNIRLRRD